MEPVTAPADLLLVTVTKVESQAVLAAFERHTGQKARIEPRGDRAYQDLGLVNGVRVWLALSEMGSAGVSGALQTVTKAIGAIRPVGVIMVGIAFGMNEKDQAIGDILVAKQLRLYDLLRVGTDDNGGWEIRLRGARPDCSGWLLNACKTADLHWHGAKVRPGCVLTGDKLVDNFDFRAQLLGFEPEAIGGDMEGAGLYVACQDAKVDWLLVKAICDWGCGKKEGDEKARQQLAATNAAAFVLHTLNTVPLIASATKPTTDAELLKPFHNYLHSLAGDCAELVTRGIPLPGDLRNPLRLAHVYAQLETTAPRAAEPDAHERLARADGNLTALEVVFDPDSPRVVLVGEPGCGKSTLLQYITLCLADQLARGPAASAHLAGVPVPDILRRQTALPLRILLREFAASFDAATGCSDDVVSFLTTQLQQGSHTEAIPALEDVLKGGLAFVLLDGLDEVPKSRVAAVRQAITAFATGKYHACRVAVTCRTESYKLAEFTLPKFPPPRPIAPLSPALRSAFIRAWYRELEHAHPQFRGEGAHCGTTLLRALDSERLDQMSRNPFFLTAMAALHRPDKPLPDTGAKLMDELVTGVLEESRLRRSATGAKTTLPELPTLLASLPDGFHLLRLRLEAIAYKARETRKDHDSRFLDEDLLRQRLRLAKTVDDDWVDQLLEILRHRAGLLHSKDGKHFEFAYRFEEFLAGCYLTNDDQWPEGASFARRCEECFQQQGNYARQVILWAAGFNVHVRKRQGAVRELVSKFAPARASADEAALARLELAADIARDARMEKWEDDDVPDAPATILRLRTTLEVVRDDPRQFPVSARSRAASSIGRLHDRRPGVGLRPDDGPQFVWCGADGEQPVDAPLDFQRAFPAQPFLMGGDPEAFGSSKQPFECTRIQRPYFLAKFPVTVAQYQVFVDAGGYGEPERDAPKPAWWADAGWAWRNGKAEMPDPWKDWYQKLSFPILRPEDYEAVYQTPNHPRVGVSWHEATAYCRWLAEQLHAADSIRHWEVRLPTDAEWELAARWNRRTGAVDGRIFPWGNPAKRENLEEHLAARCNFSGTKLNHTSAAGLFAGGLADCDAADLAGNVWEWCQSKWVGVEGRQAQEDFNHDQGRLDSDLGTEAETRVLRGGAWSNGTDYLRAAFRFRDYPGNRYRDYGFRLVCAGVFVR
jgi:formylglycine-generating enzyme required for sulfatase activity/nucleoside phosphorylase